MAIVVESVLSGFECRKNKWQEVERWVVGKAIRMNQFGGKRVVAMRSSGETGSEPNESDVGDK